MLMGPKLASKFEAQSCIHRTGRHSQIGTRVAKAQSMQPVDAGFAASFSFGLPIWAWAVALAFWAAAALSFFMLPQVSSSARCCKQTSQMTDDLQVHETRMAFSGRRMFQWHVNTCLAKGNSRTHA